MLLDESLAGIGAHDGARQQFFLDFGKHFLTPEFGLTIGREGIEENHLILRGRHECENVLVAFVQFESGQDFADLVPRCAVNFLENGFNLVAVNVDSMVALAVDSMVALAVDSMVALAVARGE